MFFPYVLCSAAMFLHRPNHQITNENHICYQAHTRVSIIPKLPNMTVQSDYSLGANRKILSDISW